MKFLSKKWKKTVIFLIFADIQRHNFNYTGRLLGLWASECSRFYSKIFIPWRSTALQTNKTHFTSFQKNSLTEKIYWTLFDNIVA